MKNICYTLISAFVFFSCAPRQITNNYSEKPVLVSSNFSFTEGPAADEDGNVYFTDQPNDKIYKWSCETNQISTFLEKTGRANGTYFDSKGNLLTCSDEKGEILAFSKDKNKKILLQNFNGKRLNGPNDLWIDKASIYFTDPLYVRDYWKNFKREIFKENVYLRKANGEVITVDSTFTKPNGIIGNSKEHELFVSDFGAGKTYKYKIEKDGSLRHKTLFCAMGSDGMTIDEKGNVYLTGNGVTVFDKKGHQIKHIEIPEEWTANVTFGGKNFSTLFITASKSVYILQTNMKGLR